MSTVSITDYKLRKRPSQFSLQGDLLSTDFKIVYLNGEDVNKERSLELLLAPPRLDEDAPSPANRFITVPIGLREEIGETIYDDVFYYSGTHFLRHGHRELRKVENPDGSHTLVPKGNFNFDGDDRKVRKSRNLIVSALQKTSLAGNLNSPTIAALINDELWAPQDNGTIDDQLMFRFLNDPKARQYQFHSDYFEGREIDYFPPGDMTPRDVRLILSYPRLINPKLDEDDDSSIENSYLPLSVTLIEEFEKRFEDNVKRRIGYEDNYIFNQDNNFRNRFHLSSHGYLNYVLDDGISYPLKIFDREDYTFDKEPDRTKLTDRDEVISKILNQGRLYPSFEENSIIDALKNRKFYLLSV